MPQRKGLWFILIALALVAVVCFCGALALGVGVLVPWRRSESSAPGLSATPTLTMGAPARPAATDEWLEQPTPTDELHGLLPGEPLAEPTPTEEPSPQPTPTGEPLAQVTPTKEALAQPVPLDDLLAQEQMPPYDPVAVASGLQGGREIPRVVHQTPAPYKPGDKKRFWIGDLDLSSDYEITATLRVQGEWVQMWVDDRAQVDQAALQRSADTFDTVIHPAGRRYFGSEWDPGVDGDSRLVVLNALFSGAAGYFYSVNQYSQQIHPHSNEHEMFVMNVRSLSPGSVGYDAVLAHEFQHMILWREDANEEAWVSEGSSDLSEELSGYPATPSTISAFTDDPDLQLTHWPDDDETVGAHYGASFLMMHYFFHRFGPPMLRDLVSEEANGSAGFDAVLARAQAGLGFDDLFADWVVANGVDDPDWDDGRYGYALLDVQADVEESISRYPFSYEGDVAQYASDYFELRPAARGTRSLELSFSGDPQVKLVPNDPASGSYQWWSNRGDSGHSSLQRALDLTRVRQATLSYSLWYDIERGWDYAYVRISEDEGRTWQLVRGQQMTDYNPIGNALGPGYTGQSGRAEGEVGDPQWARDEIDLSPYGGKRVLLSFDYITDDAVNRPGLCLDDFELQGIGWRDDAESGEEGWRAAGFIRHDNNLPQRYVVQVVEFGPQPLLTRHLVEPGEQLNWTLEGQGTRTNRALLIVSAIAPVTTERAAYQFRIE